MLLQISITNHLSFKTKQQLSLVASSLKDVSSGLITTNVPGDFKVLPSVVIYGANASGKSNFVNAVASMKAHILTSHPRGEAGGGVPQNPFALSDAGSRDPTEFEVDFIVNSVRYNYGYQYNSEQFLSEWLFAFPSGYRRLLFRRDGQEFKFGRSLTGRNAIISELTRPNSLFLSAATQNAHEQLTEIVAFFRSIRIDRSISVAGGKVSAHLGAEDVDKRVIEFLGKIGTGVTGYRRKRVQPPPTVNAIWKAVRSAMRDQNIEVSDQFDFEQEQIELSHQSENGQDVFFELDRESAGTRRLLVLLGEVCRALDTGSLFVLDELDASLHTQACDALISLFCDPATNPLGAQMIATTHDTNLLASPLLRRDQIWFTEKDPDGSTELYPLTDIRTRKHDNIEKGYLEGRYGAVPFAGAAAEVIWKN